FGDATYEFFTQQTLTDDFSNAIVSLPYKFVDPHRLDKKVDPRRLKFGSRIQESDNGDRFELYSVTDIVSPEILKLSNGLFVRLLGVLENPMHRQEAMSFLVGKTKGEKVFLKFDNLKYDDAGNLLAYVYLKNKTFLNAHLIKSGHVSPDTQREYKYRHKFQNLLMQTNA
ncbi:MAG: thermonuclease family protein, partial [Bacteroidota bacterium]|nr:thermonuclease family protein [Bacteroidota bacterium]